MMIFYLVGMVWMGMGLMVVVDLVLCVYGIVGLWVVDVFVMLIIVLGNIYVLVMMIVEKVVQMIFEDVCG